MTERIRRARERDPSRLRPARQSVTVLFSELPPWDSSDLLSAVEPLVGAARVVLPAASAAAPNSREDAGVSAVQAFRVDFGPHRVVVVGSNLPATGPDAQVALAASPMPEAERAALRGHRGSVRCLYLGNAARPLQQLKALYRVAAAWIELGGLGILQQDAWLAQPAPLVRHYLPLLESNPPLLEAWVGQITLPAPPGFLFCTRGLHRFELPDLVTLGPQAELAPDAQRLFLNVALYLLEQGRIIDEGDTLAFRGRPWRLTANLGDRKLPAYPGPVYMLEPA
ncbi:MAG: DUF4261 domain-containing protein [Chloroflexi bacterium]|nr:DUF4261 domain-containing protein [Chloroflexota bacterium]